MQGRWAGELDVACDVLGDVAGGAVRVALGLRRHEEQVMGSGTNRKWWGEKGSRSGRRSNTKSMRARRKKDGGWMKMKAYRAEAARRSNP